MKKVLILCLAVASLAFSAEGGAWGGFYFSGLMPNLDGLNTALGDIDRNLGGGGNLEFTSPFFVLGGEGGLRFGPLTVAAWGGGFFDQVWGDTTFASLGYGMGYAEVGLEWDPVKWLTLRPAIDLGGAGLELEVRERYGSFGQPEDTLYEPYHYTATAGQGNVGGNLEVQFNVPIGEYGFVGIMLKAGYLYPFISPRWHDFEGDLIESPAPSFGIHGPYVSLGINLGARGPLVTQAQTTDDEWNDF